MISLLCLAAVIASPLPARPAPKAISPTVTVVNGMYDPCASVTSGSTIDIWANPAEIDAQTNMVFSHWTGATQYLADPNSSHTTLLVPSTNITVTATYVSEPMWTPTTQVIGMCSTTTPPTPINRIFYFPPGPIKGLIFLFHALGVDAQYEFTGSPEYAIFTYDAVARGYAVCAIDSCDRKNNVFSIGGALSNNPDTQNVAATIQYFISQKLITASTPLFCQGMSDGTEMAVLVPWAIATNSGSTSLPTPSYNFEASACYCAYGVEDFGLVTRVPTIFNVAENDDVLGAKGNTQCQDNCNYLLGRGIRSEYNVHVASPVYPGRFASVPGLAMSDSVAIYQAIKAGGFLSSTDYVLTDPDVEASALGKALPSKYSSYALDLLSEIDVSYTSHDFYSDFDDLTLDFFDASTPVPPK
jgi:hypothetical protein